MVSILFPDPLTLMHQHPASVTQIVDLCVKIATVAEMQQAKEETVTGGRRDFLKRPLFFCGASHDEPQDGLSVKESRLFTESKGLWLPTTNDTSLLNECIDPACFPGTEVALPANAEAQQEMPPATSQCWASL